MEKMVKKEEKRSEILKIGKKVKTGQ